MTVKELYTTIIVSYITFVKNDTKGVMIMSIYGYCRISRKQQNIERQIRNILELYPDAILIKEAYTGTTINRKEWNRLYSMVNEGDTIIFDSVSRMSRNAEEGFSVYQELFNKGINLIFIKEPHINTSTFKTAINKLIPMTGTNIDFILEGINKYLLELAKEQIRLAFEQSEKEVLDLRKRTSEGLKVAKTIKGKRVGAQKGDKYKTKKSIQGKKDILKYSKDFNGSLSDKEVMKLTGISRNTYYKYKRELKEEA